MSLDVYLRIDPCEHCGRSGEGPSQNITHNVYRMWRLVGVYSALYESEDKLARDVLPALRKGVETMRAMLDDCRKLNPENGWGNADGALRWLEEWTASCEKYPNARIEVSA